MLGLASTGVLWVLTALEFWRENSVAADLAQHGVTVRLRPVLSVTPLAQFSWVRKHGKSIALPYSADFLYEADVSTNAIAQLRWLPCLQSVTFGKRWTGDPAASPPAGRFVSDDDLIQVGRLAQLRSLFFNYSNLSDDGLKHLTALRSLEELELKRANVSDAGLVHIGRIRSLTYLSLQQTNVTGSGLIHLRGLQNLTQMSLQSTPLVDGSLGPLAELPNLQYLDLDLTLITDASIEDLVRLKSLTALSVMGLSEGGMERLQQALPNCEVLRGPTSF